MEEPCGGWWGEREGVCVCVCVCVQGMMSFEGGVSCFCQRETETRKDTGTPATEQLGAFASVQSLFLNMPFL